MREHSFSHSPVQSVTVMRRERADSIRPAEEIPLSLEAGYMCAIMTFICLRDEDPLASREGSIYAPIRPRPTPTGGHSPSLCSPGYVAKNKPD